MTREEAKQFSTANTCFSYEDAFRNYTFADGTPFGAKEEVSNNGA